MPEGGWFARNTYHHGDFRDIAELVRLKERKGVKISLCFPTLNEEATIGKEIVVVKSELQTRNPLLDEIVVIDSGSTDGTIEVAREYGAKTFAAADILPSLPVYRGKGENLWKALYVLEGDIIVYIDADIKNIHPRFIYGLLGPLLTREDVRYVKAFYQRPIVVDPKSVLPASGGRVTELLIRPLFSLFFPELAEVLQPLSGEYAAYRDVLEWIPFPIGYGVETSMLIDIYRNWGMDVIAQVDLDKRVHRNQSTQALGRMSFGILKTFIDKLNETDKTAIEFDRTREMIQFEFDGSEYRRKSFTVGAWERPPMITIKDYASRTGQRRPAGSAAGGRSK